MIMYLIIIGVILLLFLASLFVKISFGPQEVKKPNTSEFQEEEIPPASSSHAKYNEARYDLFRFADFFLMTKRPFGIIDHSKGNNKISTSSGNAIDLGRFDCKSAEKCVPICEEDPYCNAWDWKPNDDNNEKGECTKYTVLDKSVFKSNDSSNYEIGYVFSPKDEWAVSDLSDLPSSKLFFTNLADMVIVLRCKTKSLRNRAETIRASFNIKYCYENTPISELSSEYIDARQDAIESLERAVEYFIFSGQFIFDNKVELALLSINLLLNDDSMLFINDIEKREEMIRVIEENQLEVLIEKLAFFQEYLSKYDNNNDGYISRNEYANMIREDKKYIFLITSDLDVKEKEIDENTCMSVEDINTLVDLFFNEYDSDNDGRIHLRELTKNIENILINIELPKGVCTY
tara:strand:- start:5736 stop:6947 length:1212 start_codon:yes stop_codon:yes gene_type:complete